VYAVNGYDERFQGWGREDSELTARLLAHGLRRRRLRFAGIVYHLWHPEQPRETLAQNDRLFEEATAAGSTWCEQGVSQHVARPAAADAPPDFVVR